MAEPGRRVHLRQPYRALPPDGHILRLIEFVSTGAQDGNVAEASPLICSVKWYSLEDRSDDFKDLSNGGPSDDWYLDQLTRWQSSMPDFPYRYIWGDWVAMSHCWGNPEPSEVIYVNDEPCEIPANMASGLRAISQLPAVRHGMVKVWNDFLCLDQHNAAEIQRELKRVPRIYSNAFAVISWIGPAADQSTLALDLLRTKLSRLSGNADNASETLKSIDRSQWRALISMFLRPYWRRMWVCQEMTLAGSRTMLLCGNDSAPWAHLWELVKAIIRNAGVCHHLLADALGTTDRYHDPVRHDTFSVIARLLYLHDIDNMRRHRSQDSEFDLLPLMDVCRGSEQQYLRDKVYGILGLLPSSITRLVEPDLNKPPHYVFTDLVIASVQALGRLDILQNCMYDPTNPVLPTWTPDLRRSSMSHALGSRTIMNAGGDLAAQPRVSPDRKSMHCHGFLVDAIDHLTPPQWPLTPISPQEANDTTTQTSAPPRAAPHDAFWKVLVSGSAGFPHDGPPPPTFSALLDLPWPTSYDTLDPQAIAQDLIDHNWCTPDEKQDLTTFVTFRQRAGRGFDIAGRPLGSFFPDSTLDPAHAKPNPEVHEKSIWHDRRMLRQACMTLKRRRLFVTREGRLGVCSRQARPGDVVAVLRGCSTPLLLRSWSEAAALRPDGQVKRVDDESEQPYVVIGACYVEGVMQGEWLDRCPEREEEILLV